MFKELDNYLKNNEKITIILKNGQLITGCVEVSGNDHLIIRNKTHVYGIAHSMIGMWEVESFSSVKAQSASSANSSSKYDKPGNTEEFEHLFEHISAMQAINKILGDPTDNGSQLKDIKLEFPAGIESASILDDKRKWNRINDQYRSSVKNNNLCQLPFLASELSQLAEKYPLHGVFNCKAGMFYSLVNEHKKAACQFKNAFLKEPKPEFIYNAACEAFKSNPKEETYLYLGLYFNVIAPWDDVVSWKQFCLSAIGRGNYYIFKKVMALTFCSCDTNTQEENKEKYDLMIVSLMLVLIENKMYKKALKLKDLLGTSSFENFSVIDLLESMIEGLPLQPDTEYDDNTGFLKDKLDPTDPKDLCPEEIQTCKAEVSFRKLDLKYGNIYSYKSDRGFGFLRDDSGTERYFYYTDIQDDELRSRLNTVQWGNEISVLFEPSTGPEGQYTARNIFSYKIMENIIGSAEAFYKEGSLANAICEIKEALCIEPDSYRCKELCEQWEKEYDSRHPKEKKQVVNMKPESREEWYEKACFHLQLKQYEEALLAFDNSKYPGSDSSSGSYGMGIAYFNSRRYEEAIGCLEKAISLNPLDHRALYALGSAYLRAGEIERSIEHLNKANALRPDIIQYRMNMANALFLLGKYEGSIDSFNKLLFLDPDNYVAWSWKAAAHLKNDQLKEANSSIEKALSLNPIHADSLFCKGYILSKEDRCEEALEYFDQALRLDPVNVKALAKRCFVLSHLSRHKEALLSIEKAISLNRNNPKSWYYKGIAHLNAGEYEKAVEAFNTSLEIKPGVSRVLRSRSSALSKLGKGPDTKLPDAENDEEDTILFDDLIDTYDHEIQLVE